MPTLSSILVQRGAASMRAVEDAIARQVLHGGDLPTNLLELAAVREDMLCAALSESFGIPAAPMGRLHAPNGSVLRLVPGELALRNGIFPLALEDRTLVVATAEPLPPAVEDDLGFALDLAIRQLCAPLVRVRQAIAENYSLPLERRFLRLVAKLDGRVDPSPSALPPPDSELLPVKMPRPISVPAPNFGTGLQSTLPGKLEEPVAPKGHGAAPRDLIMPSIPRSPGLPQEIDGLVPSTSTPVTPEVSGAVETPLMSAAAAVPTPKVSTSSKTMPAFAAVTAPVVSEAPDEAQSSEVVTMLGLQPAGPTPELVGLLPARDPSATRALAGVVRQAIRAGRAIAPLDKRAKSGPGKPLWRAQRRKGPFTAAMAEHELEEASATEAVLEILFAFAQQFFEYTVLFVVHGDLAEGRDAAGPGADRAKVAGIGVALDLPSALSQARDRRAHVVARMPAEGLDAELQRDLGRTPRQRAIGVLPVIVRSRVVALLYGDDGEADVQLSSLGEVVAVLGLASAALERIALRKKLGGKAPELPVLKARRPGSPRASEARGGGAAALARALSGSFELGLPAQTPLPDEVAMLTVEPAPVIAVQAEPPRRLTNPGVGVPVVDPAVGPRPAGPPSAPPPGDDVLPRIPAADAIPSAPDGGAFGVPVMPPARPSAPLADLAVDEPGYEGPGAIAPKTRPFAPLPPAERDEVPPSHRVTEPDLEAIGDSDLPAPSREDRSTPFAGTSVRRLTPPIRRGLAPVFEGRAAANKGSTAIGFEPLPRTPPPNATAWSRFAESPPPALAGVRPAAGRPIIPRVDEDSDSPGGGVLSAATDRTPGPALQGKGSSRPPPPKPAGRGSALPSVIVDVAAEYQSLIQRALDGGRGSREAFNEIVRQGEQALPALLGRFPGPLAVDRHRARGELPAASQCGTILELIVAIRRPALPFISVRTSSTDPEIRFWATHVLGELRYAEAANVLVPRLFDDDAAVRRVARRSAAALVSSGPAGAPILQGLDHITRNADEPTPHRLLAIETMGEIRSGAMVPPLIAALSDGSEEIGDAARRALLLITRQDFAHDVRRWQEWWTRNSERHRIEWLMDALMHEQPSLRRAAGDELKLLTKEYFGYYDDLPKKDRERAQGLYRAWWEREGRQRFS